jgi:hypothetical protein
MNAEIRRLCQTVFTCHVRLMLNMTSDTGSRVDVAQRIGVSGVREFTARMRIKRFFPIFTMAINAGFLQHFTVCKRLGVTGIASDADLVVPTG